MRGILAAERGAATPRTLRQGLRKVTLFSFGGGMATIQSIVFRPEDGDFPSIFAPRHTPKSSQRTCVQFAVALS